MKKHRCMKKAVIAAALVLSMAGSAVMTVGNQAVVLAETSSEIQNDIDNLEAEQNDLKKQQQEVAEKLASLKADKQKQLEYQAALDQQMESIQKEISVINRKIKALDQKIREKQAEIAESETVITDTFNQLKKRIHALYLAGEASSLEILLNSESIADFADKAEVMRSITSHDAQLIDTLKSELAKVKEQKAEIEENRQKVADARSELEAKQQEVEALTEECKALIEELNQNEAYVKEQQAKLKAETEQREKDLKKAYADYYNALSAEEKAAREKAAKNVKKADDKKYNNQPTNPGSGIASGSFIWPVPSATQVVSGVGPRWGTNHNGVDIPAAQGSAIVASDGGTVYISENNCPHNYYKTESCGCGGGFGNYVIIDHGNGYFTTYGHMTSTTVSAGQTVSRGQQIGTVGSTGYSMGFHLHFELRQGFYGSVLDPLDYIPV